MKSFTLEPREKLEGFVRRCFRDLDSTAFNLYMTALPGLEYRRAGYGKPFPASQDVWGRMCHYSRPAAKTGLETLAACGLIHLSRGSNGFETGKRLAAIVRRCSIAEIKSRCPRETLERFTLPDAERLSEVLNKRGIPWNGKKIYPRWFTTHTGRIDSKGENRKPPHNTKNARLKAFRASLKPDEILLECDYSAAEPTVICHDLTRQGLLSKPVDPLAIYAAIEQAAAVKRETAKALFNKIAYSPCARLAIPSQWNLPLGHFLRDLVPELQQLRDNLWRIGKPTKELARHAYTMTNRLIVGVRYERNHRGQLLAWRAQGTVADVLLSTLPAVLEAEDKGLCRFFMQAHDALYVAVPHDSLFDPASIMEKAATDAGLPLRVKTTRYEPEAPRGKEERKRETPPDRDPEEEETTGIG